MTFEIILPLLNKFLKVITNCMATANIVSCTDALTVAKASGMNLNVAYEAMKISSGTWFVNETESQDILF